MKYEIIFAAEAVEDIKKLSARERSIVLDAIEIYLQYEPAKVGKSRIKRLMGIYHPQYRLRVGEIRIFYDVIEDTVEILAIVLKSKASEWLDEVGGKK
jgi:mRNA-degrading endonuclease RelE of RelBE toxin-antitoxin system